MRFKNLIAKSGTQQLVTTIVVVIFLIISFTTPLAVFLGSHLNQLDIFKAWKEIVITAVVALILLAGAYRPLLHIKDRGMRILVWLIVAYAGWTILLGLLNLVIFDRINWEAFIYASIVNLRFLLFFLLCWLLSQNNALLRDNWKKLLLIPAGIIIGFGLLQAWVLPANVLEHVGYGPKTITAYQTVDQHPEYVRIQSTLRGPNPLGAYLVVIISALLIGLRKRSWPQIALLAGALVVLFYTYSRSAWLGVVFAVLALLFVSVKNPRPRRYITIAAVAAVLVFSGAVYMARDNQFVQKTVFHTDETSVSPQSSNAQRAGAIRSGLHDVVHEPFGRGPGSAGPASLRNDHPERIAENYFLQIGQEVGWIGLACFLAIVTALASLLWRQRQLPLAKVLLASLAGILVINMLSHAWTDETLALIWWGLAGVALATPKPQSTPSTGHDKSPPRS